MRASKLVSAAVFMVAVFSLSFGYAFAGPPQGVDRYQATTYTINVASVNGVTAYWHTLTIEFDCTYEGSGVFAGGTETLSDIVFNGTTFSAKSVYDAGSSNPGYTWYPSFTLKGDGSIEFVDLVGDNVTGATGTWTEETTTYKNHGEWVAASVARDGRPDAHSCIGMPVVSNGKNG